MELTRKEEGSTAFVIGVSSAEALVRTGSADSIEVRVSLDYIDGLTEVFCERFSLNALSSEGRLSFDPRVWGTVVISTCFFKADTAVFQMEPQEFELTAKSYTVALIRDYHPTAQFANLMCGLCGGLDEEPILVLHINDASDTPLNLKAVSEQAYLLPGSTSFDVEIEGHPFESIGPYLYKLLALRKESTLHLYLSDISLILYSVIRIHLGNTVDRVRLSILSDGGFTVTKGVKYFKGRVRGVVRLLVGAAKWAWVKRMKIDLNHKHYKYFWIYFLTYLAFDKSADAYVPDLDYLKKSINGTLAQRLLNSGRVHELRATQAYLTGTKEQQTQLRELYGFDTSTFEKADKSKKRVMAFALDHIRDPFEKLKVLMTLYGPDYLYCYKGHPYFDKIWPIIDVRRGELPQGCEVSALDKSKPVDVLLAGNPNSKLSCPPSSAFMGLPASQHGALILYAHSFVRGIIVPHEETPIMSNMEAWIGYPEDFYDNLPEGLSLQEPSDTILVWLKGRLAEQYGCEWLMWDKVQQVLVQAPQSSS